VAQHGEGLRVGILESLIDLSPVTQSRGRRHFCPHHRLSILIPMAPSNEVASDLEGGAFRSHYPLSHGDGRLYPTSSPTRVSQGSAPPTVTAGRGWSPSRTVTTRRTSSGRMPISRRVPYLNSKWVATGLVAGQHAAQPWLDEVVNGGSGSPHNCHRLGSAAGSGGVRDCPGDG
jgi:hypothetical protein